MKNQTNRRIIIWTSVIAILGVGGYFAYTKIIKPILDKRKADKGSASSTESAETPVTPNSTTSSSTSSGDKSKTQEQMKGEAISKGLHAYRFWDSYLNKWRYFTTGKNASNGLPIKSDIEIFQIVPIPPATIKGATMNFQSFLNSNGASLVVDGIFGLQTANAAVKFVNKMKTSGNGWRLNNLQKNIIAQ